MAKSDKRYLAACCWTRAREEPTKTMPASHAHTPRARQFSTRLWMTVCEDARATALGAGMPATWLGGAHPAAGIQHCCWFLTGSGLSQIEIPGARPAQPLVIARAQPYAQEYTDLGSDAGSIYQCGARQGCCDGTACAPWQVRGRIRGGAGGAGGKRRARRLEGLGAVSV